MHELQTWSEVSLQLLKNFNHLLTQLCADSFSSYESLSDTAAELSANCEILRSHLTPSLLEGVPRCVFTTMRMFGDNLLEPEMSEVLEQLGFMDEAGKATPDEV